MAFDFALAIEKLQGYGYSHAPITAEMRDKYPELDFLFDEIDASRYDLSKYGSAEDVIDERDDAKSEADRLAELVDEADNRLAQLGDMAMILTRMRKVTKADIEQLMHKADDAQQYLEKMKTA